MAGKLTDADMEQVETWIEQGPKRFRLLYSITRDGCEGATFHQKCDNQGPTLTVLYNQQNSVYGAFTTVNWTSNTSGQYCNDGQAFIFQLQFSASQKATKFPVKNTGNAIYCHSDHGPTFGSGHDLLTFNQKIEAASGTYALNGKLTIGTAFDAQGVTNDNVNNGHMTVTELEVYKVTDCKKHEPEPIPEPKPWRDTPELNGKFLEKLRDDIEKCEPLADLDINEFRLVMLGPVGSGKSSFYNTVNSVFNGRITQRAISGTAEHSTTTQYRPYQIRTPKRAKLNLRLCDTRGLESTQGLDTYECNVLLEGHIPDFYKFNPSTHISIESPEFVQRPTPGQKVHCAIFVIDADTIDELPEKLVSRMKNFREIMNEKGIPQAVLLTKIDKVSSEIKENPANVFKNDIIKGKVESVSKLLGLPPNNIFPVKNYDTETELDSAISALALLALRQVLYFAADYMENLLLQMEGDMYSTSPTQLPQLQQTKQVPQIPVARDPPGKRSNKLHIQDSDSG